MEAEINEAIASLAERSDAFREQIAKAKEYRERLTAAGVSVAPQSFAVPLMQRLETPSSPVLANYCQPNI